MEDLETYRKMGQDLIDKLKLTTYPIAIKIMKKGEEMPKGTFFRPHEFFGSWLPTCTSHFWTRRSGISFYLEGEDISLFKNSPQSLRNSFNRFRNSLRSIMSTFFSDALV